MNNIIINSTIDATHCGHGRVQVDVYYNIISAAVRLIRNSGASRFKFRFPSAPHRTSYSGRRVYNENIYIYIYILLYRYTFCTAQKKKKKTKKNGNERNEIKSYARFFQTKVDSTRVETKMNPPWYKRGGY